MGKSPTIKMIVRNRLLALLYRIGGFVLSVFSILFWSSDTSRIGIHTLCYLPSLLSYYAAIIFFFLIVFTAIDLRKGFWGIASGLYMPIGMSLTFFSFIQLTLHLGYTLPTGAAFLSLGELFACFLLPLYSILEWLLFEEKGTVNFSILPLWYLWPTLYLILTLVRPSLWSSDPLLNGTPYPYAFMNFETHPVWLVLLYIVLATAVIAAIGVGLIVLNNLAAGKYRRKTRILQ
ncbi:MAG: hypothetical protein J5736_00480 [Bacilli bacterium]|nr:hypothetical protein [Bacilli bacterium]